MAAAQSPMAYSSSTARPDSPVSPLVSPLLPTFPDVPRSGNAQQRVSGRSDAYDMSPFLRGSNTMSRTESVSTMSNLSARASQIPSSPTNVHPAPAYVAQFGASQVVSERKRRFSDDEDDEDVRTMVSGREEMQFSSSALMLVNGFLDQLLYSFLSNARSTTLTALRPAVVEVLKSRLAAEAIASAEEELQELLAGGEDEEEEMNHRQTVAEQNRKWDTELVWKRTRLRVMVYIRLGEMEDDDEERFVREDELFHGGDRRFSHSTGLVSWAAAIFLTSVLEYVAEQVLQAAARAADSRARRQTRNPRVSMSVSGMVTPVDGVNVEDYDMEKVALNSTLGRLWRTWRKSLRSNANGAPPTPTTSTSNNFSRRFSREVFAAGQSPRGSSFGVAPDSSASAMGNFGRDTPVDEIEDVPEAEYPEHVLAANIPLPMDDEKRDVEEIETPGLAKDLDEAEIPEHILAANISLPLVDEKQDVDEIEVPGLARDPDEDMTPIEPEPKRRHSLTGSAPLSHASNLSDVDNLPDSSHKEPGPAPAAADAVALRQRSASVPIPVRSRFFEEEEEGEQQQELGATPVDTLAVVEASDANGDQTGHQAVPEQTAVPETENTTEEKPLQPEGVSLPGVQKEENSADLGVVAKEATGGSAALAAAAVTMVYGSKFDKKQARKSMPLSRELDFEERDNQKQLVNTKRLSVPIFSKRGSPAPKSDEPQLARKVSLTQPRVSGTIVRTRSTAGSEASYGTPDERKEGTRRPVSDVSLKSNDVYKDGVAEGEDAIVNIGVARTSDTAVSIPRGEDTEWRNARDAFTNPTPRRQSRLILGTSSPEASSSPARRESPPAGQEQSASTTTPQGFLEKRSLSVSKPPPHVEKSKAQAQVQSQPPHNHTHSTSQSSKRASTALETKGDQNSLSFSSLEKTPGSWRQSFSAAAATASWVPSPRRSPSESGASGPVQEHPVVQKIANMKRTDSIKAKEEEKLPLTSASIKGPEDFEMFVQGADTVKYTLTPENVREGSSPVDVNIYPSSKSAERTPSVPKIEQPPPAEGRMGRSQTARHTTSTIIVPPEPEEDTRSRSSIRELRRSVSRPPVRNVSVHRKSGLMAREPQVMTESTRDFADFIRSTGPTKEPVILPLQTKKSATSLNMLGQPSKYGSRSSSPGGRSLNRVPTRGEDAPPMPPMPSGKGKSIMQPRGAKLNTDTTTSELIEFIRSGPKNSNSLEQARQHRISRSVAPFRTTEDSDQLKEWGNRIAAQPDIKLNTSAQSAAAQRTLSMQSSQTARTSANSRSALLDNTHDSVHPAHSGQPQRLSGKPVQSDPAEPKRYRGKDPYSMDFLDEENDDLLTALPKSKREEESLIDFLKNADPPTTAGGATAQSRVPSRTDSGPGLKPHGADAAVNLGRRPSIPTRDASQPKTTANMAATRQSTTSTTATGPLTKPVPESEPRGAAKKEGGGGATADLADFLRTSGPPQPQSQQPASTTSSLASSRPHSKTSMTSGKSKKSLRMSLFSGGFFSKRAGGKTSSYLDM